MITRFDRDGPRRIPFLSAHSLLGLSPGEPGAYTLLADGIRQFGHDTATDLHELWRRLVFSLLANATPTTISVIMASSSALPDVGRSHPPTI